MFVLSTGIVEKQWSCWLALQCLASKAGRRLLPHEFKILQCITSLHVAAELQVSKAASDNGVMKGVFFRCAVC